MVYHLKINIIISLFITLFVGVSYGKDTHNNFFKPFFNHLSYYNYDINSTERLIVAKHPRWLNIKMRQYKGGIAFVSFYYKCKKETIADSENFFVFINELNTNFTVSKAIVDLSENEWSLVFAAWYPGSYEKKRFSIFIDSWNHDTSILFRRDSEKIKRYLK